MGRKFRLSPSALELLIRDFWMRLLQRLTSVSSPVSMDWQMPLALSLVKLPSPAAGVSKGCDYDERFATLLHVVRPSRNEQCRLSGQGPISRHLAGNRGSYC